ncbi:glycoside hydrolase family 2 protein [Microbacteriaceae bacterium VKM Ac-2854]|nr:glycoside hydrolase family 2 protein [Microbacteriaceae bacterium VKM Ac-2854]
MALTPLHTGWTMEAVTGPIPDAVRDRRIPAAVPGCAHTDLLAAELIEAPFDGDNEAAQQWIGSTVWRYSTTFDWRDDGAQRHDLVADGLDTVATIELNGSVVARTQNQHRGHRFDVAALLVEGENSLVITFAAPVDEAEARAAAHGPRPHVNHHPYNALRKAASNFGWDWGIDVATSGIWKAIGLDSWSGVRIASLRPLVDVDGADGVLDARVELEWAGEPSPETLSAAIGGVDGTVAVPAGATSARIRLVVPDADLWWPRGHGEQPLYPLTVAIGDASWSGRIGFRTVTLDTAPDADGTPFVIVVNGEPIQIRGANWIPDHAFVAEIDRARYRRRVQDAVDANMNLLRVWGGGLYESDDFYDACDEAGVLVWQDFLFACAAYAEEDWLAEEVEAEARQAITRLSAHPSLALWNGNNENLWGYVEWGWRPALAGATWGNGYYRELLPALVAELDPTRPYSPGSPFSFTDYLHPNDPANGTMHIWDVWNTKDYTVYRDYKPRFASEFGFQGPPAWSTLTAVVHDEPLDPYGVEMLVHQKAEDGNLKLERGLRGHLPEPRSIEDWHWATQLNQAAALRFGIEHFRSLAPLNTGTIVWQLNDNWPVVSWAAVDFDEHRKPLWYALRDAYAPRLATIQPREEGLALVLLNDTAQEWVGAVRLRRLRFDGTVLAEDTLSAAVDARGVSTIALPEALTAFEDAGAEVLVAELDGFARAMWNPAEVVAQRLDPDPVAVSTVAVAEGYEVTVTARSYVRDVTLLVDLVDPRATVDAGLVTLLAGESATFRVGSVVYVDPSVFATAVRHANGLLVGAAR